MDSFKYYLQVIICFILILEFSEFEAHKSKSKELTSRLLKVFIV